MSGRHARTVRRILLVGLGFALLGCGASAPQLPPGAQIVTAEQLAAQKAQVERLAALEAKLTELQASHQRLQQRLDLAEARARMRPWTPEKLQVFGQPVTAKFGKALRIEAAGEKPAKTDLGKQIRSGRGVVVAFWATWCKPCIADEELALLAKLRDELGHWQVELVSMAIDGIDKVVGHEKAPRWFYPLWQQDDGHIEALPREFIGKIGLGLPLFLLLAPDGTLRYYHPARLDEDVVREMVTAVARGL